MHARNLLIVSSLGASLAFAGVAAADHIEGSACGTTKKCADHQFWPKMKRSDVQRAGDSGSTLRGSADRSSELLGGHGSDRLYGGRLADVLWADADGTGQPTSQWDRIWGGDGNDFIYSARGRNTIYGQGGNDAIKIRYGRGLVDCGAGRDIINVPRKRKRNWTIRNCEKIDYRTEAARGEGLKPLP